MKLKKFIIFGTLSIGLSILLSSSCQFNPCQGQNLKECAVLPSFDGLFQSTFEICGTTEEGEVACRVVQR